MLYTVHFGMEPQHFSTKATKTSLLTFMTLWAQIDIVNDGYEAVWR